MKKPLLFFALAAAAMTTGCAKLSDPATKINYIYKNESSSEIAVYSCNYLSPGKPANDSLFVIPVHGQHTISFIGEGGYVSPFEWGGTGYLAYVAVSNGERKVTQTRLDIDGLYMIDNYSLTSEAKQEKTVSYVFTDDFFENGELIE